jgi:hypothetical protein
VSDDFEFDGGLDLTGATGEGVGDFPAIPGGKYRARVRDAEWRKTGGGGKLPEGTPYLNVQMQVHEDEEDRGDMKVANRVVFSKLFVAPSDYDAEKSLRMKNSFVNFLTSVGYDLKEVQSAKFRVNIEDLIGRECVMIVKKSVDTYRSDENETVYTNDVQGYKPAGELAGSGSRGLM